MNNIEFNIRLYLTGVMKSWTDRIDNTGKETPQRFILNAMTELFDSLSEDNLELIRLRYMERLTLSEVASRYLLNERTVRNHTNPAINQVKEIIKKATEQAQHAREVD
ncbi:sigma factor-like helix-turn-helix DNA-binding protein [Lactococcus sp. NH2-7C]|uniref:sigma factor-like helix-turn-helix DNA-binding protein n=1 Tax=Lactococcus sp. NH2-7C TaxID=2879149 RepID=UPI001CDD1785|nr:sigma factor-like helix-turn-helix DNA-binding protein [Lactococcus sp. NH2-7C]MCA2390776.1 sigma-70 family RNA polymerase sigma factor [Lactococcus sp. NH2-7C]WGV31490.1 sigma factor-like helix-turn-helix DNA-binding protein [Lactococcus sp. NH2-7C]